jgi:hypothetical protein
VLVLVWVVCPVQVELTLEREELTLEREELTLEQEELTLEVRGERECVIKTPLTFYWTVPDSVQYHQTKLLDRTATVDITTIQRIQVKENTREYENTSETFSFL